jgi:hypothetical protein
VPLQHGGDHRLDRGPVGDVERRQFRLAAGLLNRRHRAGRIVATRRGNDNGAAGGQLRGNGLTDAARRAGDDRYFSAEIEHAAMTAPRSSGDPKWMT